MILTPIPRAQLGAALDRFAAQLHDAEAHAVFARIRATSCERARGDVAEHHRRQALQLAEHFGVPVHPPGAHSGFNWDGAALDADRLREHCRALASSYKVPDRIEIRAALPVTETGKLFRRALKEEAQGLIGE